MFANSCSKETDTQEVTQFTPGHMASKKAELGQNPGFLFISLFCPHHTMWSYCNVYFCGTSFFILNLITLGSRRYLTVMFPETFFFSNYKSNIYAHRKVNVETGKKQNHHVLITKNLKLLCLFFQIFYAYMHLHIYIHVFFLLNVSVLYVLFYKLHVHVALKDFTWLAIITLLVLVVILKTRKSAI